MSYDIRQLKRDLKKSTTTELYMTGDHWGKSAWNFLYNIALSNQGSKKDIHKFLINMCPILPCEICQKHYKEYLKNTALPKDHSEMFQWLQNLENIIAQKKYKNNYKHINRFRQVQKNKITIEEVVTVNENGVEEIVIHKKNCKRCMNDKTTDLTVQMQTMIGVNNMDLKRGLNNGGFLRQQSFFGKKI